jgi:hypothetical protein
MITFTASQYDSQAEILDELCETHEAKVVISQDGVSLSFKDEFTEDCFWMDFRTFLEFHGIPRPVLVCAVQYGQYRVSGLGDDINIKELLSLGV